ncbi:MAG: RNA polymerase sigma factor, partial [Planctomycetota bacterium]
ARALVRDPSDAEDIVQEALGAAFASTTPIEHPRGFLAVTARRLASGLRRDRRHRKDREIRVSETASHEGPPADASLESMDTLRVCLEEVRELPRTQAQTLSLRYVEGLTIAEVAAQLGTHSSTVRSNLSRGLAALRTRLDERLGGREAWCATLIPMALPGHVPTANSVEAGRLAAAPSAASVPAAALFISAMNLKLAAAVAAPVLLTVGLYQLPRDPESLVSSETSESAPAQEPSSPATNAFEAPGPKAELADLTPPRTSDRADAPLASASDDSPAATATLDLDILFRDLFSPEPLFAFDVTVTALDANRSQIAFGGEPTLKMATGADGRLRIDSLPPGTAAVGLKATQREAFTVGLTLSPKEISLDDPKDVYVGVGPTYRFRFEGAAERPGIDWAIVASGPNIPGQMPITSKLQWLETETGFQPWTRFSEPLGRKDDEGPWTLELRTLDGILKGSVEVPYGRGSRAEPFPVLFETLGAIRFILDSPRDPSELEAELAVPQITLIHTESGDRSRARLLNSGERIESTHGQIAPGRYEWQAPGQVDAGGVPIGGVTSVATGEVTTVRIPPLGGPDLKRSIIVDASAVPEADLSDWSATALNANDIQSFTFLHSPSSANDLGPGHWRIQIGPVPQKNWMVQLSPSDGYAVSPDYLQLRADGSVGRMTVTRTAPTASIQIMFHDAITGEPLDHSTSPSALIFKTVGFRSLGRDATGQLRHADLPTNSPSRLLCRASGYQMTEAIFEPGNGGNTLRVDLLPGWRSRVYVMNLSTAKPQPGAGVIVDGEPLGETNEAGVLWLDLDGPPKLIELGLPEDLELKLSPFRDGLLFSTDPEEGYGFVVEDR